MNKAKAVKTSRNRPRAPKLHVQVAAKGADKAKAANRRDFTLVTRDCTCYALGYD